MSSFEVRVFATYFEMSSSRWRCWRSVRVSSRLRLIEVVGAETFEEEAGASAGLAGVAAELRPERRPAPELGGLVPQLGEQVPVPKLRNHRTTLKQRDLLTHQVELLSNETFETARIDGGHGRVSHDRSRSLNHHRSRRCHGNGSTVYRRRRRTGYRNHRRRGRNGRPSRAILIRRQRRSRVGHQRVDLVEVAHEIAQGEVDSELVAERLADLGEQERIEAEFEIRGVSDQFLFGNPGEIGENGADRFGDGGAAAEAGSGVLITVSVKVISQRRSRSAR